MFLRQSTSQVIRFGPFLDSTDGVTAETGLTIAQSDMQLSKDGGAFAQKNTTGNATHDADGWYSTTLDTTDTATVGELYMQVNVSGALPVWVRYWVIEEAVYDAVYGASAAGYVESSALPSNFADMAITPSTGRVTAGTVSDKTGYSISGTKTTLDAMNDLSAAQVNAEADTALADYDAPTKAELVVGVAALNDLDAAGIRSALGMVSADLDTQLSGLDTKLGTPEGVSLAADIEDIETLVAALNDFDPDAALTEGYATDGTAFSMSQGLYMIWSFMHDFTISGTTRTSRRLNNATAMTHTLDDGTTPTGQTRAT